MALTDNLIAWYQLDESSGNAADASGNGRTLTNTNSVTYTTGKIGSAASFPHTTGQTLTRNDTAFNVTGDFTVQAWYKPTNLGDGYGYGIVSNTINDAEGHWMIQQPTDRVIFTERRSGGNLRYTESNHVLATGNWYHVVVRRAGSTNTIWVNATEISVGTIDGNSGWGQQFFCVGNAYTGGWEADGLVDMVGFWNRAISDAEIGQLYAGGAGLDYPFSVGGPLTKSVADALTVNEQMGRVATLLRSAADPLTVAESVGSSLTGAAVFPHSYYYTQRAA